MRKTIFLTILIFLTATCSCAQKIIRSVKTEETPPVQSSAVNAISETDWNFLAAALENENWPLAANLARQNLPKLKFDNDKKQLAQLRYMYLYALAGEILAFEEQKNVTEREKVWNELDIAVGNFIGKEFILPPRPFSDDCNKKLNFICQVKDNSKALRTTATNKEGSSILSFDYVLFDEDINIKEFDGKKTFLGGFLQKADYNVDLSKPWVIRLYFEKGFARVVVN